MEFKDYIFQVLRFWPVLFIFPILGGVAGFIFSLGQTPKFTTAISVYFAPAASDQGLSQTANEFTDSILGILTAKGLGNYPRVEIKKVAPQIVEFQIQAATKDEIWQKAKNLPKDLAVSLEEVFGPAKISLKPLNPEVEVLEPANLTLLNILVGAALGFVLAAAVSSAIIYFKS